MSRRHKPVIKKKKPNRIVELWKAFGCSTKIIILVIMASLLLFHVARDEAKYKKLREHGVCTFGTIYDVNYAKQNKRIHYEFEASDGLIYKGTIRTVHRRSIGTLIRIVYLRADPTVNAPADQLGIDCSCRWAD